MSVSYQLVELRTPKACHLTCFVDRTGKPLGEWNRLWSRDSWIGWSKLPLFRFIVLSPLVPHEVSRSRINQQGQTCLCDVQRQCGRPRAIAYDSARGRSSG